MKKILLVMSLILSFNTFSFSQVETSKEYDKPDFRGVWIGETGGCMMIWKDEKGDYQCIIMNPYHDVCKTLKVELIGNKLLIESIFLETNWRVTQILTLEYKYKISVEGRNPQGNYNETLTKEY